ncbi:MAG: aspartate--ammonia ligase [Eubacteriales bacterium]
MNHIDIPAGYRPALDEYDTQRAIEHIKRTFQQEFSAALNLKRVSAPLFVTAASGLNDNLNGYERPVSFDVPALVTDGADSPATGCATPDCAVQVVHSLAKWKRLALKRYHFSVGNGLYTDMNAIRRDEELDNVHSIYVDQWDWEKIITRENRNLDYLKLIVRAIVKAICATNDALHVRFPQLRTALCPEVSFITSQELEDMYPGMTSTQRENAYLAEHKTAFIMQIGGKLRSGKPHDGRAPDYDDWALNGDLFFWHEVLGRALEISSMGIRVDAQSLDRQLTLAGCPERRDLPFHQMLLRDELPLTIGGGIGQSRLCMLMMGCAHIGEVQSSVWDAQTVRACEAAGIPLL